MSDVSFEEPPPLRKWERQPRAEMVAALEKVRAQPTEWARVAVVRTLHTAQHWVLRIKAATLVPGRWEATYRTLGPDQYGVWVRYLGDE